MKSNYNAREGLSLCRFAEPGFALGTLTILGGLAGTIFAIFTLAGYIIRLRGMKKAVMDNVEYQRASRLMMIGTAVTASLILISFYKKSYNYTMMMVEMNAVLTILSTFMIFRATVAMLEYNGRTGLIDQGKKAWMIYWILYAVYLICSLSGIFVYFIGEPVVRALHIVGIVLAFAASFFFYRWLERISPVL